MFPRPIYQTREGLQRLSKSHKSLENSSNSSHLKAECQSLIEV